MKKVFVFIFLSLFTCSTIMAHPIFEREQAIKDAEADVELVKVDNFLIGASTSIGVCLLSSVVFFYEFQRSTSSWPLPPITTGSLLGASTLGIVYLMSSQVPAAKLLGKSPEYVYHYTKTYQNKLRVIRAGSAVLVGTTCCVVGVSIMNLLFPGHSEPN